MNIGALAFISMITYYFCHRYVLSVQVAKERPFGDKIGKGARI